MSIFIRYSICALNLTLSDPLSPAASHLPSVWQEFLLLTLECACTSSLTYEHPLYRSIFLHRGRFVYCPFLLVQFAVHKLLGDSFIFSTVYQTA